MSSIENIDTPDLRTEIDFSEQAVSVRLIGTAESAAASELNKLLKSVHSVVREKGLPEVVVDLRPLEFMNSSCFKAFVSWVGVIQESAENEKYKVRLLSDQKKHWQSRSLGALQCFAVDLIRVESS